MKKSKVLLTLLLIFLFLLPLVFVICTLGPFVLLSFTDRSHYSSEEVNLAPLDYSASLAKAEEAGYTVRGSWPWPGNYSGFDPEEVADIREKLREKFGSAVIIREVALCYDNNSGLVVSKYEGRPETLVVVSNISHDSDLPLKPSEFPEGRWMLEMFGLLFNLDEKTSQAYLTELETATKSQKWDARIKVNESLDFLSVYEYLQKNCTKSEPVSTFREDPNVEEIFFRNGSKLGCVRYLIPQAEVKTFDNRNEYVIKLRSSGEVSMEINMPDGSSGKKIPEKKYRAVFRKMFENMGLPSEVVDRFKFTYRPSNW
jgi:hypothetical protein